MTIAPYQRGLLFDCLDPDVATELETSMVRVELPRGRRVFVQGQSGDSLFVVRSGLVKLVHGTPPSRPRVLALVGPGEVFGEASTFGVKVRDATARAVTDTTVLELSQVRLTRWLQDRPDVAWGLLRHVSRRLSQSREEASALLVADSPTRVAVCLLQLAAHLGVRAPDGLHVAHGLTQVELSELVGVARETVNKVLREFAGRGWLDVQPGVIVILDLPALTDRADLG